MAKKNKTNKNKQKAPAKSNKKVNINQAMEIKPSWLESYLPVITLFLVCVLLFYPPFFQGLLLLNIRCLLRMNFYRHCK